MWKVFAPLESRHIKDFVLDNFYGRKGRIGGGRDVNRVAASQAKRVKQCLLMSLMCSEEEKVGESDGVF